MKINSIKISNILSFEHKNNIDECQEIKFKDGINVIIGPNGSGKSNFLEILNQLFSTALFQVYEFSEGVISAYKNGKGDVNSLMNTVRKGQKDHTLQKNHNSNTEVKRIKLEIGLSNNDLENLIFIKNNLTEIEKYIAKYAHGTVKFPDNVTIEQLKQQKSIILVFEDPNKTKYLANITTMDDVMRFVWFYINHFNLLQHIIYLGNREEGRSWKLLKNTFAMMSSYRNYNSLSNSFEVQQNEIDHVNSLKLSLINGNFLQTDNNEPTVFAYVKCLLGYPFHHMISQKGLERYKNTDPADEFKDPLFININEILAKTIGLRIHPKQVHPNTRQYVFNFINIKNGKEISIGELSSGEKGLIYFVLAAYGHDLHNGMMMIDEPEIHLHPQMQEICLNLLDRLSQPSNLGIQFIIVTHSPIFANSKTMDGIIRFYRENNYTKVTVPKNSNSEKDLVKFLDYTRATRVLFSNKIVMVEGESDEYFYRFYLSKLQEKNPEIVNLEFIFIGGNGYYPAWKKFFDDWKIKTCFIRDLDDFKGTTEEIEQKYQNGIFILKQGKLEDYLAIGNKKLESVLDFCQNGYEKWKIDLKFSDKINEIDHILKLVHAY